MKFFHLSDLHIGLKLINRDLREDQEYILHQITELAVQEQPDAPEIFMTKRFHRQKLWKCWMDLSLN